MGEGLAMKIEKNLTLRELILIRFLASTDKGLSTTELKKSLQQLFNDAPTDDDWKDDLGQLVKQNKLQRISKAKFQITTPGKQAALQTIGVSSIPGVISWPVLKNRYLMVLALGLPIPSSDKDKKQIGGADGLRASILAKHYQLDSGPFPTITKARDCLLWQLLADPQITTSMQARLASYSTKPFKQAKINELLLNALLGTTRELPAESALKQLVAKITNARRTDIEEVRQAILRAAAAIKPTQATSIDSEIFDLETFAAQVLRSASKCQTCMPGYNKVFVSKVWEQMGVENKQFGLDLEQLKQRLVQANSKRLLNLSRADLPYEMNLDDVAASEITYLGATFNLIELES